MGVGNLPGMSEPSLSSITIYQLRVVLCGVSPLVWRRLLVASDTTIAELHEILQSAFADIKTHLIIAATLLLAGSALADTFRVHYSIRGSGRDITVQAE